METRFNYNNITGLHLELTTICNAMCPMCNRNYKGKLRKELPVLELSLEDIKTLLPLDFIKQLKLISLCGVYGDPICNSYLFEILNYLYEVNPNLDIDIYTNGGIHDTEWWKELAEIIKKHNGTVIFGIDGLGDVHSLYRCNTDFEEVLMHAKAFISAGGKAQWDYIVFKHNEHQVEAAKALSEELGFQSFQIKKTSRFFKTLYEMDEHLDSTILEYGKHPVFDNTDEIKYYIELPENKEYRNQSEEKLFSIIQKYGTLNNFFNFNSIDCDAIRSGGIFISAEGEVYPCCSVYQQVAYKKIHGVTDIYELNEYEIYIKYCLNGFKLNIKEIVEGGFFEELQNSFNCEGLENGKPKVCSRTCGRQLELHKNSHTTKIKYKT